MKKQEITTSIILDTRRKKKENEYPVKLRVTFKRSQKYYFTGYSFTKEEHNKIMGDKPRGKFKDYNLELSKVESQARAIIGEMSVFNFEAFGRSFKAGAGERGTISWGYGNYIDKLIREGRIGTSETYKFSLASLQAFNNKERIYFNEITADFLENYQKWMLNNSKSYTTIGIYLRCLRSILNEAINEGLMKKDQYPFGKRKFKIPASRNIKKAIGITDIKKIIDYPALEGTSEHRAKDYWIFSYLSNGMNIKDLANLRYKDIDFVNETFSFYRSKTEKSSKEDRRPVSVVLLPQIKTIIDFWGTKPVQQDSYIFPILNKEMSPQKELARIRQTVKDINKYMGRIAKETGITKKVTTYTARHSFATILKRSNASIEFISESLGHSNLKTTESYLGSFDDDVKKDFAMKLIPE